MSKLSNNLIAFDLSDYATFTSPTNGPKKWVGKVIYQVSTTDWQTFHRDQKIKNCAMLNKLFYRQINISLNAKQKILTVQTPAVLWTCGRVP